MKLVRKRIVLIVVLIILQITALAMLAGALWLVKVKQPIEGKLVFSKTSERQPVVNIIMPGQYAMELTNGSIILGDTPAGSFRAQVLNQYQDEDKNRLRAIMLDESSQIMSTLNHMESMDVTIWIRKQRALAILLDRSTMQGSAQSLLNRYTK